MSALNQAFYFLVKGSSISGALRITRVDTLDNQLREIILSLRLFLPRDS